MTSAWDQNQATISRVITNHITKATGGKKRQGHDQALKHGLKIEA